MTDPRNIQHDKKVQHDKKNHGEALPTDTEHVPQPGKKPHQKHEKPTEPDGGTSNSG